MDDTLIANLDNTSAVQSYLSRQSAYDNNLTPLAKAQQMANEYASLKQRVPMTIEYYQSKGQTISVEMYINPQRLTVSTQKVKYKAYTRGGIFYHHWGDDHWQMELSGTVGYAGMKGIYQLEKIYHHSGALLRYQNLGPEQVGNSSSLLSGGGLNVGGLVGSVVGALSSNTTSSNSYSGETVSSSSDMTNSAIGNGIHGSIVPATGTFKNMDLSNPFQTVLNVMNSSDLNVDKLSSITSVFSQKISSLGNGLSIPNADSISAQTLSDLKIGDYTLRNLSGVYDLSIVKESINSSYTELSKFVSNQTNNGIFSTRSEILSQANQIITNKLPNISSELRSRLSAELVENVSLGVDNEKNSLLTMSNNGFMNSSNPEYNVLNQIVGGNATYKISNNNYSVSGIGNNIIHGLVNGVATAANTLLSGGTASIGSVVNGIINGVTSNVLSSVGGNTGYNDLSNKYNSIGTAKSSELESVVSDIQNSNEARKVTRSSTSSGWRDIQDELDDEWRPRQIWIYFEDRVYIGHCDAFQWSRDAQSNLIQYSLKMTIFRQIITNSNSSSNSGISSLANVVGGLLGSGLSTNTVKNITNTLRTASTSVSGIINGSNSVPSNTTEIEDAE